MRRLVKVGLCLSWFASYFFIDSYQDSDTPYDQDSSEYSGKERRILRRRTLASVPLPAAMGVSSQSQMPDGNKEDAEKRRMTVPTQVPLFEATLEQRESGLKNLLLFLIKGERNHTISLIENKDLKHKLESVSLRQQSVLASTIKKLEERQAEMTRQMANDLEQMMQRHQEETESLKYQLQQREEELDKVNSKLVEMESVCLQREKEIAELQKNQISCEEEAKQELAGSISPTDHSLQDQKSDPSQQSDDPETTNEDEAVPDRLSGQSLHQVDPSEEMSVQPAERVEETISPELADPPPPSLSSELQMMQLELESERCRHIEEIELLQESFGQQQARVKEQYEADIASLKRHFSDEAAAQIKAEQDKQTRVIQILNDRILTLSETATRSMEAHHEIKEKYEGMKVEYQNLYDLYQELKSVTKEVIAAVKTKGQRITVLENMLSERGVTFAKPLNRLDIQTKTMNDFDNVAGS